MEDQTKQIGNAEIEVENIERAINDESAHSRP
jgi:hypothetical protein